VRSPEYAKGRLRSNTLVLKCRSGHLSATARPGDDSVNTRRTISSIKLDAPTTRTCDRLWWLPAPGVGVGGVSAMLSRGAEYRVVILTRGLF
jgi:hypothetical protein